MSGNGPIVGVIIVAVLILGWMAMSSAFTDDCKAHGGAHVTYPYKAWPECWDADGRRLFW
jgi:hypothetical protein